MGIFTLSNKSLVNFEKQRGVNIESYNSQNYADNAHFIDI